MRVRFSYLKEKFTREHSYEIFKKMWDDVISSGDFTLGRAVKEFEEKFAELMGVKYAIGVANGTDALELSLWAAGVRAGDEVIVPANTFVASLGAIGNLQAIPVLVDIGPDYVIDPSKIKAAITSKTKAIIPVHFTGQPCAMDKILEAAGGIPVIEDACQAYLASYKDKRVGTWGLTGAFSLHPLKILNVWGDGGVITTNDDDVYREIRLHQNHGLFDRDTITRFPCRNSRLDSIHAAVGTYQISETPLNVEKRRLNAFYYDQKLADVVHTIPRYDIAKSVFHLYMIEVDASVRDALYKHLLDHGVEAKIHYKTPLYQQPGLSVLGYKKGDFPVADAVCDRIITLPVDELVTREMQDYVIKVVRNFFGK